jgi:hypothetical protein
VLGALGLRFSFSVFWAGFFSMLFRTSNATTSATSQQRDQAFLYYFPIP